MILTNLRLSANWPNETTFGQLAESLKLILGKFIA